MACTVGDLLTLAETTVFPIFVQSPNAGTGTSATGPQYPANGLMWVMSMGLRYQNTGCSWWANRLGHWGPQLANMSPVGGPSALYHYQLKLAKHNFALQALTICGCQGQQLLRTSNTTSSSVQERVISSFTLNTEDIPKSGAIREFTISGDPNAVFSLQITNEDSSYYNFSTKSFQAETTGLKDEYLINGVFNGSIKFPTVGDDDHYNVYLIAGENTVHNKVKEVRFDDDSLDINLSSGSNSKILKKIIYQYASDVTLTIHANSINTLSAWGSVSVSTRVISLGKNSSMGKRPFEITVTSANTRAISINRQPIDTDIATDVSRTIGSAPINIESEDTSSGHYKWPINNIVGLTNNTEVIATSPVAAGTTIDDYVVSQVTVAGGSSISNEIERLPATETTGNATVVNGVTTVQPGNVIFNKQIAASFADDTVKFWVRGVEKIKQLDGWDLEFSNLKVELTPVTTTTTSSTVGSSSTSVAVASRNGILDNVSTVSGVGIDNSSAVPTVASGAGAVSGSGTIVLSAAQELESGVTLTFGKASTIATITGDITINKSGTSNETIYFDLETFLTAT